MCCDKQKIFFFNKRQYYKVREQCLLKHIIKYVTSKSLSSKLVIIINVTPECVLNSRDDRDHASPYHQLYVFSLHRSTSEQFKRLLCGKAQGSLEIHHIPNGNHRGPSPVNVVFPQKIPKSASLNNDERIPTEWYYVHVQRNVFAFDKEGHKYDIMDSISGKLKKSVIAKSL